MLFAADIGGTKSHLALCFFHTDKPVILIEKKYPSKDFRNVEELLALFFKENSRSDQIRDLSPAEISNRALTELCPFCKQSLRLFSSILGAEQTAQ
ncbi:MAG: hypothetical protein GX434_03150 [Peptococcaceae bacterium]|nr:hypothetical protein [Peptococcaceae bacterium]